MAEDERETTRKAQLALGKAVAAMIEEGVADGSVRPCKPVVTSRLLFAAFNGVARLPIDPARTQPFEMAEDFLNVLFQGLIPTGGGFRALGSRCRRLARHKGTRAASQTEWECRVG